MGSPPPVADLGRPALGAALGALLALALSPAWVPALAGSLGGVEPPAYWYLSRASGLTAYGLIWLSITLGLAQSTGLAKGATLLAWHRHAASTGIAFTAFHALVLLGDRHVGGDPAALLVPFAMRAHAPGWVGLGQLAAYGLVAVAGSFALRRKIGARAWRGIHYASFTVFVLVVVHAALAGSDAGHPVVIVYLSATTAVVAALVGLRLLRLREGGPSPAGRKAPRRPRWAPR